MQQPYVSLGWFIDVDGLAWAGARRFLKLSGFSRHASRQDLLSVLEQSDFPLDSIRSIDAIIKPGMLPSDTYVVEFDSQAKVRSCAAKGF